LGPNADFATGSIPYSVATADFNRDGKPDLAVANNFAYTISVLLGDGTGGFGPPTNFPTVEAPRSVTAPDLNRDGKPDLAVANVDFFDTVSVRLGDGSGGFGSRADYTRVVEVPVSVTAADFNRDGNPDLAVSGYFDFGIAIMFGNGSGGFASIGGYSTGSNSYSVTSADFNRDGNPDLAVANYQAGTVSVALGDGTGGFGPGATLATGPRATSVTSADFNRDGAVDLVLTKENSDSVSVLLGDGAGGFGPATYYPTAGGSWSVASADFNRDGAPDLAVLNAGMVSVLLNELHGGNIAPMANDDAYSTDEDTPRSVAAPGVLGNDTDVQSDPLTASLVTGPSNATSFALNSDGSFDYTPTANFNGTDSFTYRANDGSVNSNTATVTITVNPVNDRPTVAIAGGQCMSDVDALGSVSLTLGDVDNDPATLTVSATSSNQVLLPNANLALTGSGTARSLSLFARNGKSGTAVVTVVASDGTNSTSFPINVIVGKSGNDTLTGKAGPDVLFGLAGNDILSGMGGDNLLCGEKGTDQLNGGDGSDVLDGGSLNDVLSGGNGNDNLLGQAGADTLTGGADADFFSGGSGVDTFTDFNPGQGDTTDGT
jgi:Ca2+-binding RTX toxin-like protein